MYILNIFFILLLSKNKHYDNAAVLYWHISFSNRLFCLCLREVFFFFYSRDTHIRGLTTFKNIDGRQQYDLNFFFSLNNHIIIILLSYTPSYGRVTVTLISAGTQHSEPSEPCTCHSCFVVHNKSLIVRDLPTLSRFPYCSGRKNETDCLWMGGFFFRIYPVRFFSSGKRRRNTISFET